MGMTYTQYQNPITEVKEDKRKEIWTLGTDNQLPILINDLIKNSPTASKAVSLASKAIIGGGIDNITQINKDNTLSELFSISAKEHIEQTNLYFQIGYNGDLKVNSISLIPQSKMRRGKSDDLGFTGYYHFDNDSFRNNNKKTVKIHTFNPSEQVIKAQIEASKGMINWKGQILHIKADHSSNYSLPLGYSVMQDMLTENNSAIYRACNTISGYLNNNLLILPRLDDDQENRKFINQFKEVEGAVGSGRNIMYQTNQSVEDIQKIFALIPMSQAPDDKLFEYSDAKSESNIAKAYNIPEFLINPSDSGLFGNSGELLVQAKQFLYETYEDERNLIVGHLNKVLKNWHDGAIEIEVTNPYKAKEDEQ